MAAPTTSIAAMNGRPVRTPTRLPLTTPGWLRLAAAALVTGLLVVGALGVRTASERLKATRDAGRETAALVEGAQEVYVSLADADAAATAAFLASGLEPPELQQRYRTDINKAELGLVEITADSGLQTREALRVIGARLPVYTGLVETARANNRMGFPVGAAYLKQASALMREQILPAATTVYEAAAEQLDDDYQKATSVRQVVVLASLGAGVLIILVVTQLFVAVRTRRILNLGLSSATLLVVVTAGVVAVTFIRQQDALVRAQREGSDGLIVLSTGRILALRALSDENLDLIERGTEEVYMDDFEQVTSALGGGDWRSGLLGDAREIASLTGTEEGVDELTERFAAFMEVHEQVRGRVEQAAYGRAVEVVESEAEASSALDDSFEAEISAASARLDDHADDARDALRGVALGVGLAAAAAALLVLVGLDARIREYR